MKKVYGSKDCGKCVLLKLELEEKGEEFEYIDIETLDIHTITELCKKAGTRSLPIVVEE